MSAARLPPLRKPADDGGTRQRFAAIVSNAVQSCVVGLKPHHRASRSATGTRRITARLASIMGSRAYRLAAPDHAPSSLPQPLVDGGRHLRLVSEQHLVISLTAAGPRPIFYADSLREKEGAPMRRALCILALVVVVCAALIAPLPAGAFVHCNDGSCYHCVRPPFVPPWCMVGGTGYRCCQDSSGCGTYGLACP